MTRIFALCFFLVGTIACGSVDFSGGDASGLTDAAETFDSPRGKNDAGSADSGGATVDALVPTCVDGEQNGDEEGIDCGGSCDPCVECVDGDGCPSGLCVDETCRVTQMVPCVDEAPANATSSQADVVVNWDETNGWSTPSACDWTCDADYFEDGGGCINQRIAACIDVAPNNATSTVENVVIDYTTANGWETPRDCYWSCNTDYDLDNGACINSQLVACLDVAPANATSTVLNVTITYTTANGWSSAAACPWTCNTDFDQESSACINQKIVDCIDAAPSNASSTLEGVGINYTTANGWETPRDCFWDCNPDYFEEGDSCVNTRVVVCNDVAPSNAWSTFANVVITYTTANGWSAPEDCAWQCNANYDLVGGVCINQQTVSCVDVAPTNGTSTIVSAVIGYSDQNGWETPPNCDWSCNPGYCAIGNACIGTGSLTEHKFVRSSSLQIGSVGLGVTNSGAWNRGLGQSVTLPQTMVMNDFAINTSNGFATDVNVKLQLWDTSGNKLASVTRAVAASNSGGWLWFGINYTLQANVQYVFTLHLPNALEQMITTSINVPAVFSNTAYPGGSRWFGMKSSPTGTPLENWSPWSAVNEDLEFWITSDTNCTN